jgi:hypothetical protein
MTRCLLLTLSLVVTAAAPARAADRPVYRESAGDPIIWLARLAPLTWQPMALMALDMTVPLVAGTLGGLLGASTGAALAVATGQPVWQAGRFPVSDTLLTYVSMGALLGGTGATLAADAAFATRHLDHLVAARVTLVAMVLPGPLWASMTTLSHGWAGLPSGLATASTYLGRALLGYSLCCGLPLGLLVGFWTRFKSQDRLGSPLWEETR